MSNNRQHMWWVSSDDSNCVATPGSWIAHGATHCNRARHFFIWCECACRKDATTHLHAFATCAWRVTWYSATIAGRIHVRLHVIVATSFVFPYSGCCRQQKEHHPQTSWAKQMLTQCTPHMFVCLVVCMCFFTDSCLSLPLFRLFILFSWLWLVNVPTPGL